MTWSYETTYRIPQNAFIVADHGKGVPDHGKEGVEQYWLTIQCKEEKDMKVLPTALVFEGRTYTVLGWNPDTKRAHYTTGEKVAFEPTHHPGDTGYLKAVEVAARAVVKYQGTDSEDSAMLILMDALEALDKERSE